MHANKRNGVFFFQKLMGYFDLLSVTFHHHFLFLWFEFSICDGSEKKIFIDSTYSSQHLNQYGIEMMIMWLMKCVTLQCIFSMNVSVEAWNQISKTMNDMHAICLALHFWEIASLQNVLKRRRLRTHQCKWVVQLFDKREIEMWKRVETFERASKN